MAQQAQKVSIKQINLAIGRYYKSVGHQYNDQFTIYCEDNGLDDDDVINEIDQEAADCLLVEFDDEFPWKDDQQKDKEQFIYDLIRKCVTDPDIVFEANIPEFAKLRGELFKGLDLDDIRDTYQEQCSALWTPEWLNDIGLLMMLAAGKKHQFDYLMHLVDDYGRYCIKTIGTQTEDEEKRNHTEQPKDATFDWSHNHKHFEGLDDVSVQITKHNKLQKIQYTELATCAVKSFRKRVCKDLQLKSIQSIDDSLEDAVDYIYKATMFISNLIQKAQKEKKAICPFQIDFCFATGEPIPDEKKEDAKHDDGDDDDDDIIADKERSSERGESMTSSYVDCVDNVKIKLKDHNIKYRLNKHNPSDKARDVGGQEARVFAKLYENLLKEYKLEGESKEFEYLHKKRLIALIDRRNRMNNGENDVWMYEAPKDCRHIPDKAVPEWYINASVQCVLPSRLSNDKKLDKGDDDKSKEEEEKEALRRANIGAKDHCKGGLLTFSFHVKEKNIIKCYLYWNGGIIRFFPEDIKTVLPTIYNMKYEENKEYIADEDGNLNGIIEEMKKLVVDDEFKQFVCSYM